MSASAVSPTVQRLYRAACSVCSHWEQVRALNRREAGPRLEAQGWQMVGNKLLCPKCINRAAP